MVFRFLLAHLALLFAASAWAQTPNDFEARAKQLPAVIAGEMKLEDFFAPSFLAAVPASQVREIAKQIIAQSGPPKGVEKITTSNGATGSVDVAFEKAIVSMTMTIDAEPTHKVVGLLVTSVTQRDDSLAKLQADIRALPGKAGMLVKRVDDSRAAPMLEINADQRHAIGSAFKLWILAEASRATIKGERKWSDVVILGERSLPSGMMQKWPPFAPTTLHSLATMMISISDNTATDTLLRTLGRSKVSQIAASLVGRSANDAPFMLTTAEAFALKMPSAADLRKQWGTADAAQRTRILALNEKRLTVDNVDPKHFAGKPLYIDQIEWFASSAEMSRTLDWIRTEGGERARAILAVNPGIAEGEAARFAYVGLKGGSEPGVISMNLLLKTKAGAWYTVTGSWNNPEAEVDNTRFVFLVSRAVALIK